MAVNRWPIASLVPFSSIIQSLHSLNRSFVSHLIPPTASFGCFTHSLFRSFRSWLLSVHFTCSLCRMALPISSKQKTNIIFWIPFKIPTSPFYIYICIPLNVLTIYNLQTSNFSSTVDIFNITIFCTLYIFCTRLQLP